MIFAGQQSTAQRRPRHQRNAERLRRRDDLALGRAIEQVVRHLLGHEAVQPEFLRRPERFDDLPAREHAGADVAHLAGANQIVERAQCLVDGDVGLRSMQLVEIDPVGVQPLQ